jgi:hypothetical protein
MIGKAIKNKHGTGLFLAVFNDQAHKKGFSYWQFESYPTGTPWWERPGH